MAKRKKITVDPEEAEAAQSRMSFGDHLEELRRRLILALLGSAAFIALAMYYSKEIGFFLAQPYILALRANGYPATFQFLKPAEPLIMYLTLGFQVGLIIASPWIIYQIWQFVAAGLYRKERVIVYKYIGPSALLFLCGVAFFYFIVLPLSMNFFVKYTANTAIGSADATRLEKLLGVADLPADTQPTTIPTGDKVKLTPIPIVSSDPPMPPPGTGYFYFNQSEGKIKFKTNAWTWSFMVTPDGSLFMNVPRLDDYLDFIAISALVFGLAFEMPMVILVLAQIGIVRVQTFRNIRKYAYLVIAIVSAVAAPSTDIFTMLCLMFPLMGLYEAGVIAAAIVVGRQERAAEED